MKRGTARPTIIHYDVVGNRATPSRRQPSELPARSQAAGQLVAKGAILAGGAVGAGLVATAVVAGSFALGLIAMVGCLVREAVDIISAPSYSKTSETETLPERGWRVGGEGRTGKHIHITHNHYYDGH